MLSKPKVTVALSDTSLPFKLEELRIPLDVRVPSPREQGRLDFLSLFVSAEGWKRIFSLCFLLLIQGEILDTWASFSITGTPVFKVCEASDRDGTPARHKNVGG